jgi:hypothetical protein
MTGDKKVESRLVGNVIKAEMQQRDGEGGEEYPKLAELILTYEDGRKVVVQAGSCECCGGVIWEPLIETKEWTL